MDHIPSTGQELTVLEINDQHTSNALKYLNLPTSIDLTTLLSKLEHAEKEFYPQQQQRQKNDNIIQRVKLIELDSYHHQLPNLQQLHHLQLSACHKTRLFLAVAYGAHIVVAQLFALELRQVHDDADERSHLDGDDEFEDDEELEWVDVSTDRLIQDPDHESGESNDDREISCKSPVVIFPPSYANSLPRHLDLKSEKSKDSSFVIADTGLDATEITSCALIPSPSIRRVGNSNHNDKMRNGLLTQRTVAVVLGTSRDQVLSLPLHISEKKPNESLAIFGSSLSLTEDSPSEITYDSVKFHLDYDICRQIDGDQLQDDELDGDKEGGYNKYTNFPSIMQLLPCFRRYGSKKNIYQRNMDDSKHYNEDFQDCISDRPNSELVGVFDGNVDAHVEVFHPSLAFSQSQDHQTSQLNQSDEPRGKQYFGITSISFCRGQWNSNHFSMGGTTNEQQGLLIPDVVWVTYGNGTIIRFPSWKFFLSFGCHEGGHSTINCIGGTSGYAEVTTNCTDTGVAVIPLNDKFQSPLDIPPPQYNRSNALAKPNLETMDSDFSKGLVGNDGTDGNYWSILPTAIVSQLTHHNRDISQRGTKQSVQALVLSGPSTAASSLPLNFQSSRVEYAPLQNSVHQNSDESMCDESIVDQGEKEQQTKERMDDDENANNLSASSSEDEMLYGPVTGAVVGGTAALVKGALGAAFGAVRWGLGRGGDADEEEEQSNEEEDKMSEEFINADESFEERSLETEYAPAKTVETDDKHALFAKQGEAHDLFPWPLSSASLSYSDVPRRFLSATVDPSGSLVATTDNLGRVMLFDLETRQAVRMWKGMRNVSCHFAELPRQGKYNEKGEEFGTWLYLVIHLQQRGTVEIYRLRQGARVAAVAVSQHQDCVVIECCGPPSEGSAIRSYLIERMTDSVEKCSDSYHYTIDYLIVDDRDALPETTLLGKSIAQTNPQIENKLQLKLLMQLLADTNIKCNAQTVLTTFKNIRAIADLSEGLDVLSKCSQLEERMGVNGSSFHSQAVSHCKHRLDLARKIEASEGSGMVRKAAISELSLKIAYHERLICAYDDLHRFELRNDRKSSDADDADNWEARRLSGWASEAVSWISVSDGNDALSTTFASSFSDIQEKDKIPLRFSTFAIACSNNKSKVSPEIGRNDRVYLSGVTKDRKSLLTRIFQPLLHDLFVYKVTNSIFLHLGINLDVDVLQQYFGEWALTLSSVSIAKSNLSGTWRPMVRWLQDMILSAYETNRQSQKNFDDATLLETVQLGTLLKFCMEVEDLTKAFLLAVICHDAITAASKQIEERTYGKISQSESVFPWEDLLRKLRVCLLVSLRLAGDVSPTGAVNPMTVKSVSQPSVFSTYAWIARDELSLSHDNQVLMALESACLSSSEAFYPSTTQGDTVPHKRSILESCNCHRPSSSLRNPTGLTNDDHSRPLLFYLKDHAKFTAHLAAHRALILGKMWGQTPNDLVLLKHSISALKIVLDQSKEFSLATLVEMYQSRIRPVCRAMIFGFEDVHELSQDIVLPLINDQDWLQEFSLAAKQILSMIAECKSKSPPESNSPSLSKSSVTTEQVMWPPLRDDPVLKALVLKLREVYLSSIELHHTVIFAAAMTHDIGSLEPIVPSFSSLFLLGSLSCDMPAIPKGSDQQRGLLDKAIAEHAKKSTIPIVDHFDMKDIEWVGKAWGMDFKYVRTRYFVEMIRLGKDATIDDLLGSSTSSLDKSLFVEEVVQIICVRLESTVSSLKRTKSYRGVVSLLDADTSRWVSDMAAKCSPSPNSSHAPASLIITHSLVLRTQSMCDSIADDSKYTKNVEALCLMSGTLLKAVQSQEQLAMNL